MRRRLPPVVAAILVLANVFVAACGQSTTDTSEPATTDSTGMATSASGEQVLTVDDLAQFDGIDGRAAYVAVDGVVYDVSDSRMWPEGKHSACGLDAVAGRDLSEVLEKAPGNMRALIEQMPVVGKLTQ